MYLYIIALNELNSDTAQSEQTTMMSRVFTEVKADTMMPRVVKKVKTETTG